MKPVGESENPKCSPRWRRNKAKTVRRPPPTGRNWVRLAPRTRGARHQPLRIPNPQSEIRNCARSAPIGFVFLRDLHFQPENAEIGFVWRHAIGTRAARVFKSPIRNPQLCPICPNWLCFAPSTRTLHPCTLSRIYAPTLGRPRPRNWLRLARMRTSQSPWAGLGIEYLRFRIG